MSASARPRPAAAVQAYVLHRYDWSETSLVLDLFTRERGRLAVAAKGAKRPYSQLRPVLLPFQRITATLGRTPADEQSEVLTLRQAEWGGALAPLRGEALFAGFYMNELLMKLLARQDAHPALFDAYAATLGALAAAGLAGLQPALRAFELRLLRETGVLPALSLATATQQPLREPLRYRLDAESGLVAAGTAEGAGPGAAGLPAAAWVALEAALGQADGDAALRKACEAAGGALRAALQPLLHYHLGPATLRTPQVLRDVRRLLEPTHAATRHTR
jgi:DNA repair protein RecO (recombination protein O)